MPKTSIAKLFRNGRSQAVRLPREFRFEGTEVRVRRVAEGVLLEPLAAEAGRWFAKIDSLNSGAFPKRAPRQPRAPKRDLF